MYWTGPTCCDVLLRKGRVGQDQPAGKVHRQQQFLSIQRLAAVDLHASDGCVAQR